MKILYLTFYFEPDLCAGSFRNTSLVDELSKLLHEGDNVHVITTMPNRYKSYTEQALSFEKRRNIEINRITLPKHKSGFSDQIFAFRKYFFEVLKLTKNREYDLVFASSSRLFTAFLGKFISHRKVTPLYLDIRDIFVDTMDDVLKNRLFKLPLIKVLKVIENYTFSKTNHINLISGGFESYFQRFKKSNFSFYSNGIDEDFLNIPSSSNYPIERYIITYAGNIGEGQGLHKIIPKAAQLLGERYIFRVIGDGGMKKALISQIEFLKIKNVELFDPVSRDKLIDIYKDSHFLFLHLNDYMAFEKVLPSKIFEYGAFDKPIIAGVGGYSANFIKQNLTNFILFSPGDAESMASQLKTFEFKFKNRNDFIHKFNRKQINIQMAKSIYGIRSI